MAGTILESFINLKPWTQFFDLKGRKDMPTSIVNNITFSNIDVKCGCFFNVLQNDKQYLLSDFTFSDLRVATKDEGFDYSFITNIKMENVSIIKIK